MLLCCLRRTLKPSASAIAISKLYQHFRERGLPYGLQNSLPTLSPSCSLLNDLSSSAMDPRLDTGGWLTLTEDHYWSSSRQGLSPCKIRRAFLGATTKSCGAAWSSPSHTSDRLGKTIVSTRPLLQLSKISLHPIVATHKDKVFFRLNQVLYQYSMYTAFRFSTCHEQLQINTE
jgi:hypothetical protein